MTAGRTLLQLCSRSDYPPHVSNGRTSIQEGFGGLAHHSALACVANAWLVTWMLLVCAAEGRQDHIVTQPSAEQSIGSAASQEPEASVTGIPLSIGIDLQSADNLQTPFTNYVRGYSGLLDYIW